MDCAGAFSALATGSSVCVSVWTEESVRVLSLDEAARLQAVVRLFGQKSACAQGLSCAVTDLERVKAQGHQLYLATNVTDHQSVRVLGGLKVGRKKLFVYHGAKLHELMPDCVLDFYVHESCQRLGIGKLLLDTFLADAGKGAAELAYDRPSPKLLAFMRKHYGLESYTPQANNYVLYHRFFNEGRRQEHDPVILRTSRSPQLQPRSSFLPSPPLGTPQRQQQQQQKAACEATSPRLKRSRQPSADGPAGPLPVAAFRRGIGASPSEGVSPVPNLPSHLQGDVAANQQHKLSRRTEALPPQHAAGKPSPLWSTPGTMPQRLRTADDLIQAARPSRSDAATPGTGSGDSGVMLGKLASLRTTSTTASAAMEPPAVDAGVVTVVPEPAGARLPAVEQPEPATRPNSGSSAACLAASGSPSLDSVYISTAQAMSREYVSGQPSNGRASDAAQPAAASHLLTPSAQAAVLGLRQSPAAVGRAGSSLRAPWATYEVAKSPMRTPSSARA